VSKRKKVLFVCAGNIIRSPLAENIFRQLVEESGLSGSYEIDSAGTTNYHTGEHPDQRMRKVAAEHGLTYDGVSRQVTERDMHHYDLIVTMDRHNLGDMLFMTNSIEQEEKVRLLREFDPQGGPKAAVPDPYYGSVDGFHEVFHIVKRSCEGLLNALESGENSPLMK